MSGGSAFSASRHKRAAWFLFAVVLNSVVVLVLGRMIVWWPVLTNYRVTPALPTPAIVELHRARPADSVLGTVAEASMITDHPLSGEAAVVAARRVLAGELALAALPVLPIGRNFDPADLERGVPVQQLFTASLIVPDLLLRAYEHTPDPAFLAAAQRYLRDFIDYERGQWRPTGFLWNAHAVSNRVPVLARYWKLARAASSDGAEMAARVHLHALRLGGLLSKPSLFVANTNHGVMQNLGLLELAAAFPELPQAAGYQRLAMERLEKQLPFYISSEGAVLEHSAGYQFHGAVLTGHLVRVLQAGGHAVPPELQAAHKRSLDFLARLQRPDRSLPLIGNTYPYAWRLPGSLSVDGTAWDMHLRERPSFAQAFPVAGTAVWWSRETPAGPPTHTVVTWGRFAGHGHQRAQEMSVLFWAGGTDWITNTGLWPGDDPAGANLAEGWAGGNAPHVLGESHGSARTTTLRAQFRSDALRFIDLEREVASDGPRVRRQVLQWQGGLWLLFDSYADSAGRPLRVLWTAAPEARASPLGPRQFEFRRDVSGLDFVLSVAGSAGVTSTYLRGSHAPFGGWVAFDRRAVPAPSIDARLARPSDWMLTIARVVPSGQGGTETIASTRFDSAENWQVSLMHADAALTLERRGAELLVTRPSAGGTERLTLEPGAEVLDAHREIAKAGSTIRAEFPRIKTFEPERARAERLLALVWAGLAVAMLLAASRWPRARTHLAMGANGAWLAAALLAIFVYLRP